MTSREKVLSVYPDAYESRAGLIFSHEPKVVHGSPKLLGNDWDDAASKLPPGSPAGETASEEHGGCNCAPIKGQHSVYCPLWVPEPVPTEGKIESLCPACRKWGCEMVCSHCGVDNSYKAMRFRNLQPSAPEAAAAHVQKLDISAERVEKQPESRHVAAPIAPAAEELIAELVNRLRPIAAADATEHINLIFVSSERREIAQLIARAEEYAKNG